MSWDYDYLVIDWEEEEFIIVVGGDQYTYNINEHGDLLYGGIEAGVTFEEVSHTEQIEEEGYDDYDDDFWERST